MIWPIIMVRLLLQQVCNLEQFVPKILHFLKERAMSIWIFSGSIFEQENSGSILFKFRLHRYVNHCSVFFAHGKKKPTGYWDHGPIVVFSQSINRSSIDLTIKIWKKCNFWCVSIPCICQGPEEWKKLNSVDLITFEEILSHYFYNFMEHCALDLEPVVSTCIQTFFREMLSGIRLSTKDSPTT